MVKNYSKRDYFILLNLSLFLGFIGIDNFYLKKWITGVIRILLFLIVVGIASYLFIVLWEQWDPAYAEAKEKAENEVNDLTYQLGVLRYTLPSKIKDISIYFYTFKYLITERFLLESILLGVGLLSFIISFIWYFIATLSSICMRRRDAGGGIVTLFIPKPKAKTTRARKSVFIEKTAKAKDQMQNAKDVVKTDEYNQFSYFLR